MEFFKSFAKLTTLLGYSGLIVLVDEISLIVNERSDIREKSYENIKSFIDMSALGEINNCMFVFAGISDLIDNEEKGIKSYPSLYNRIINGYNSQNPNRRDLRQPIISLKKLKKQELKLLTIRTINIHKVAYSWVPQIDERDVDNFIESNCGTPKNAIIEANAREYLKKVVDILDIMEQNPGINLFKSEEKDTSINKIVDYHSKKSKMDLEQKFDDFEDEVVDLF